MRIDEGQDLLSARRGAIAHHLVDRVDAPAIGVVRLVRQPGFDHGIKAREDKADAVAQSHPDGGLHGQRIGEGDQDRDSHEGREGPDIAGPGNQAGRRQGPGQHAGEVSRTQETDRDIGEALELAAQRHQRIDQAVSRDQREDGRQQCDDRRSGGHGSGPREVGGTGLSRQGGPRWSRRSTGLPPATWRKRVA